MNSDARLRRTAGGIGRRNGTELLSRRAEKTFTDGVRPGVCYPELDVCSRIAGLGEPPCDTKIKIACSSATNVIFWHFINFFLGGAF